MTPEQRHHQMRTLQNIALLLGLTGVAACAALAWDARHEREEYRALQALHQQVRDRDSALRGLVTPARTLRTTWYGGAYHGRTTASGLKFDAEGMTCASPTLPLHTLLRVSYQGREVVVTVTDRMPVGPSELDLSLGAFRFLANPSVGVIHATVTEVRP